MAWAYGTSATAATTGTTAATLNVLAPAGLAPGDLLIATWASTIVTANTQTYPTPFTLIQEAISGTSQTVQIMWGISAGEASYNFTNSAACHSAIAVDRYTGSADALSLVASAQDIEASASDTTYPAPTVDAGVNINTLVACGWETASAAAATLDNSMLQRSSLASLTTVRRALSGSKVQAASGFTGVTTATSGASIHAGATAVFKESGGVAAASDVSNVRPSFTYY